MIAKPVSRDGLTCPIALLAVALLVPLPLAADELYRWVDEQGDVHYSDAPPADATRGRHARVREDGTTKEQVDPGARRREEADAPADEGRADRARRDRVLMETYSTVDEIERRRARHLESIEGEIGLAEHRVRRARRRIDKYTRLLEDLPKDNEHRAEMKRQRQDAKTRLRKRKEQLEKLRARRDALEQRFAEDIARFRELKADNGS